MVNLNQNKIKNEVKIMRTGVIFEKEARAKLMIGVNKLNKAVSTTLGGAGKNVMMVDNMLPPRVTKDGITVAKSITLDDFIEQAGVEVVRQASARSAKEVGDGTTTATVIATEILNKGVEVIDNLNVHDFKEGMEYAYEEVSNNLLKDAEDVSKDLDKLTNIATISANGDNTIGKVVAELVFNLDEDAQIIISEDKTKPKGVFSNIKQGYTFERGTNPFFDTIRGTGVVDFEECKLLIVDRYIARITQIEDYLEYCSQNGHPLVILYSTIDQKALENLIASKLQMGLKVCAIEFPDAGELQQHSIMDIAEATGASIVKDLEDTDYDNLGSLAQLRSDAYNTTLVFKEEFQEKVDMLLSSVKEAVKTSQGLQEADLKERIKRLSNGIGEIKIGYTTDVEYSEVYDRVEDAIGAVRSAMKEGVVIGGGLALLKAVNNIKLDLNKGESFIKGASTVLDACSKPFYQILENAGIVGKEASEIHGKIIDSGYDLGFNVRTKKLENLKELGIIDPKKVTRSALLASVSVASSILTTDCIIYPKPLTLTGEIG